MAERVVFRGGDCYFLYVYVAAFATLPLKPLSWIATKLSVMFTIHLTALYKRVFVYMYVYRFCYTCEVQGLTRIVK